MMIALNAVSLSEPYAQDKRGRKAVQETLTEIRKNISVSRERIASLIEKVDRLKKDRHTLAHELIKVAKAERDAVYAVSRGAEKLNTLIERQEGVRQKLQARQVVLAEILSVLERIGLNAPPALIAQPEDILSSIRSSIVLGALIPEMQEKVRTLKKDLKELTDLSSAISAEHTALKAEVQNQAEQRKYLELLLTEKEKLQKISEKELMEQRRKIVAFAEQVQSFEEFIMKLDRQVQSSSSSSKQMQENLKLLEKFNFEGQKGRLHFPVAGKKIQNVRNRSYVTRFGEMIVTAPSAIVTAPADALVAFAGPFRSYGKVIILNVGDGYHILLIGMAKISVNQGEIVFAGEPLGAMGTQLTANTVSLDIGKGSPMLYIEFRKQGTPVNPTPWWKTTKSRRYQDDS